MVGTGIINSFRLMKINLFLDHPRVKKAGLSIYLANMMRHASQAKLALKPFAFLAFFFLATLENRSFAAEWNQFRGPTGQGTVETDQLPLQWSEELNIGWKTAIHDKGWSSPIVCQDKIWMTTASEDGRKLYVVVVQAKDGVILWDRQLFTIADPQFAHKFNSYASPRLCQMGAGCTSPSGLPERLAWTPKPVRWSGSAQTSYAITSEERAPLPSCFMIS